MPIPMSPMDKMPIEGLLGVEEDAIVGCRSEAWLYSHYLLTLDELGQIFAVVGLGACVT